MRKENKYIYGYKFYVNYGQGYEFEHMDLTRKEMIENRKAYSLNCIYPFKISYGRIPNEKYINRSNING